MKLNELLTVWVLPVLGLDSDTDDYDETYIGVANVILRECFNANNRLRVKNGLDKLEEFEVLGADDEIPYELEMLINCVVYGVAAALIIDDTDDEVNKYGILADKYQTAKGKYEKYTFATVVSDYV